jgi:hypothetical protein
MKRCLIFLVPMLLIWGSTAQAFPVPVVGETFDDLTLWTNQTGADYYASGGELLWTARRSVDQRLYQPITPFSGDFEMQFDFRPDSYTNNCSLEVGLANNMDGGVNYFPTGVFARVGWYGGGTSNTFYYSTFIAEATDGQIYSPFTHDPEGSGPGGGVEVQAAVWYTANLKLIGRSCELTITERGGSTVGHLAYEMPFDPPQFLYAYIGNADTHDSSSMTGRLDNLAIIALCGGPTTIAVRPDGTGDYATIQEAIDAACDGDTIELTDGVFRGAGNRNLLCVSKAITIKSQAGDPTLCVLDAENATRVIYFGGYVPGAVLEGVTVANGNAEEGSIHSSQTTLSRISNCIIRDNTGFEPGGLYCTSSSPVIEGCLFYGNTSLGRGGAIHCFNASPIIRNCTISENSAPYGGAIYINSGSPQVENTTIAFNTGGSPTEGSLGVQLSCCDVFGNAAGDWVGPIAGQQGVRGNFSADPLFCDAGGGSFGLRADSPCLAGRHPDGPGCGLIGARDRECFAEWPVISQIGDVGNDQGRQVRLQWLRSLYDAPEDGVDIVGYGIFRRQDLNKCAGVSSSGSLGASPSTFEKMVGWDYLVTIPVFGEEVNQCIVPTLCDSTSEGVCRTTYLVRAMGPNPFTFYDSPADSGYSVDNLAPSVPGGFLVDYASAGNDLAWLECPDTDFRYFRVYRGTTPDFVPGPDNLEHVTIGNGWVDAVADPWHYSYKLTAVDHAGNESPVALPEAVTGLDDGAAPARFTLHANVPNPFNPMTTIAFTLPHTERVKLAIFDLTGRAVRVLVDEVRPAGRYEVQWTGTGDRGEQMASGVYVCRMEAGSFRETRRMTLVK